MLSLSTPRIKYGLINILSRIFNFFYKALLIETLLFIQNDHKGTLHVIWKPGIILKLPEAL